MAEPSVRTITDDELGTSINVVRTAFVEAIAAREAAGETLDNRLVTIERAVIADWFNQGAP